MDIPKKVKAGFLKNIVIGPLCGYHSEEDKLLQLKKLYQHNLYPLGVVRSGELFEELKNSLTPEEQPHLSGVILSAGYQFSYYE